MGIQMKKEEILEILKKCIEENNLIKCIFSDSIEYEYSKVILKLIKVKKIINFSLKVLKITKPITRIFLLMTQK